MPRASSATPLLVLVDADCGICTQTAVMLRRLDHAGRLDLRTIQSAAAIAGAPSLAQLEAAIHVRDVDGRWLRGGRAFTAIAREVPILFPVWILASLPIADRAVDAAYMWVARNRHRVSRWLGLTACAVAPNRKAP